MRQMTILAIVATVFQACIFDDGCEEIGEIDFSNNEYPAIFSSIDGNVKVNEKFNILVKTPMQMTDIDGEEHIIINSPNIWIRFTDQSKVEPLDSINVFNVGGETLHATFEEYFEQNILIGDTDIDLTFSHYASLIGDQYILEIEYKAKKSGVFKIDVGYDQNKIMIENQLESECIDFYQPKIYWQDNPINKVLEYYSIDYDQSYNFVIEVEK